jgi:hypothetical protein
MKRVGSECIVIDEYICDRVITMSSATWGIENWCRFSFPPRACFLSREARVNFFVDQKVDQQTKAGGLYE